MLAQVGAVKDAGAYHLILEELRDDVGGVKVSACGKHQYEATVRCTNLVLDEELYYAKAGKCVLVPAGMVEQTFTRSMGAAAVLDTAYT